MKKRLIPTFIIYLIISSMFSTIPNLTQTVKADTGNKQVFFLTLNNFALDRRGGWQADNWAAPNAKLPGQLLTYKSNNGAATTDIYISEPGKYQIAGYYKSHATSVSTRWFQIGLEENGQPVNYNSYKFANFSAAPDGVTGYFEGWDSGYSVDITAGKKTISLSAATLGSVRCAAIIIYKLNDGETFNAANQYTEVLDYQDYAPPQDFTAAPTATFVGNTSVKLDWLPAVDLNSGVHYEIYKNGEIVATVNRGDTSYVFENLVELDTYTFKVIARDAYVNANGAANSSITVVVGPFIINNLNTDFIFTDMTGSIITKKPATGQQVKAKVILKKQFPDPQNGELMFGLYNSDNILIEFKTVPFSMTVDTTIFETEPITMTDSGYVLRAFLWRGLDDLCSLYKDKIELR